MKLREHLQLLAQGGPGFVQIALTNACNARCRFCSFPDLEPHDWVMADPERLTPRTPYSGGSRGEVYPAFTCG